MKQIASLLLAAALLPGSSTSQPHRVIAARGDLVIENVTVVPMDREGELPRHTVVVRGDRIVAVEPMRSVQVSQGAIRIDGTGKWLMPGLADMHVHAWREDELTMFVAAGVTTVRNMFGAEQHLGWRDEIARGTLLGPTIITAGPIVDGDPATWPGSIALTDPAAAAAVVQDHIAAGYDFIKVYNGIRRSAYQALAAEAARRGIPVAGHVPRSIGLRDTMAAGQRSIEHLDGWLDALDRPGSPHDWTGYWPEIGRQLGRVDLDRLPPLVEKARANQTWQCPTLVVFTRVRQLNDLAALHKSVRWLDLVPPATRRSWEPQNDFRFDKLTAGDYATMCAYNDLNAWIVRTLSAGGVPILAGTDQGNPFVVAGASLLDELELLVAAGLTRRQALEAATTNPARFLGKTGEFGVVAPGARADLIILSTNPLIGPVPLPDGVVLRGRWLPGNELRARLTAIAERFAHPPQRHVPAPRIEGTDGREARYEIEESGTVSGEERLVAGPVGGQRVIVANQYLDEPVATRHSYRIDATSSTMVVERSYGKLEVVLHVDGERLVGSGSSFRGRPIAFSMAFPKGAFLSADGVGALMALAEQIKPLPVGGTTTLIEFEPSYTLTPNVLQATLTIERKPDAGRNRAYAISKRFGHFEASGEFVLDPDGWPLLLSLGPPFDIVIRRLVDPLARIP
jgi:imidazolonepropionase-like amidohydrolase